MQSRILGLGLVIILALSSVPAWAGTPTEGRSWLYANLTGVLSPHWGYTVMPGLRYELSDSEGDAGGVVMYEFFTGPMFITDLGPVRFILPLWYYYMGFPSKKTGDFFSSHNIELVPIFKWRTGNWTLMSRTIFHNKVFANNPVYTSDSQKQGYSLLIRQMARASYALTPQWSLSVADEVFVGVVEDGETNGIAKGEPFFEQQGLSMNRLYAGFSYAIAPGLAVSPEYIFETHFDPDKDHALSRIRHYLFVTVSYAMKMF